MKRHVLQIVGLLTILLAPAIQAESLPRDAGGPVQALLDRTVDALGLSEPVAQGRLGIALIRIQGKEVFGLGMVNGHQGFYAASLPKIAVLYGAGIALDEGRMELDPELHDDLVAMIRMSCNPCTNRVLDRIGRSWLLEQLQQGDTPFYDPELGGGLWVGKDFARRPAYERDPLGGFSHAATAWQAARFYYELFRGDLASPEVTDLMLETLSEPGINHKFVAGLEGVDATLYRKSGTWRNHHADSVLVDAQRGRYILVALARDPAGGAWLESLARALHGPVLALGPGS